MKRLFTLLLVLYTALGFAQEPSGYYDDAQGLTGSELKTALFNIITNHTVLDYSDLWTAFESTDVKDDGTVWDIYSNCTFEFGTDQCGTYSAECDCYNREHSFPKSWFNDASPMYTDLFHIYPTDGYVNGRRSNYAYGEVSNPTFTSSNGSKLGPNTFGSYSGTVFEPIDEYKGDLARTYFYMVTCYEDKVAGWETYNENGDAMLDGTTYPCFEDWALQLLLKWHYEDPVSQKEIDRNNAVYQIQGNRNPYIDHPEYVCMIWDTCSTVTNFEQLNYNFSVTNFYSTNENGIVYYIFSQDIVHNLTIKAYDITGRCIYTTQSTPNTSKASGILQIDGIHGFLFIKYNADNKVTDTEKVIVP